VREGGAFLAGGAGDAVSALARGAGGVGGLHGAAAGAVRRLPDWLRDADPPTVVCGFDADAAGDAAAAALAASGRRVRRIRPDGARDWNGLPRRDGIRALAGGLPPAYGSGP